MLWYLTVYLKHSPHHVKTLQCQLYGASVWQDVFVWIVWILFVRPCHNPVIKSWIQYISWWVSAPRGIHSKLGQGSISGGGATTPQNTFCFTTQRNIKTLQRHNTHSHSQSQRKIQRQGQVGNTQCIELCTFMYLHTCVHFISMWTRTNQSWLNNQLCLAAFYWYHNR